MLKKELVVKNRAGIHTRPAATIVKLTSLFNSEITFIRDGFAINGKSIIGVMTLAAEQGARLTMEIDGDDELRAADEIEKLFESGFGEI